MMSADSLTYVQYMIVDVVMSRMQYIILKYQNIPDNQIMCIKLLEVSC